MSPSKLRPREVRLRLETAHGDDGEPVTHLRLDSPPSSLSSHLRNRGKCKQVTRPNP